MFSLILIPRPLSCPQEPPGLPRNGRRVFPVPAARECKVLLVSVGGNVKLARRHGPLGSFELFNLLYAGS